MPALEPLEAIRECTLAPKELCKLGLEAVGVASKLGLEAAGVACMLVAAIAVAYMLGAAAAARACMRGAAAATRACMLGAAAATVACKQALHRLVVAYHCRGCMVQAQERTEEAHQPHQLVARFPSNCSSLLAVIGSLERACSQYSFPWRSCIICR